MRACLKGEKGGKISKNGENNKRQHMATKKDFDLAETFYMEDFYTL